MAVEEVYAPTAEELWSLENSKSSSVAMGVPSQKQGMVKTDPEKNLLQMLNSLDEKALEKINNVSKGMILQKRYSKYIPKLLEYIDALMMDPSGSRMLVVNRLSDVAPLNLELLHYSPSVEKANLGIMEFINDEQDFYYLRQPVGNLSAARASEFISGGEDEV